MPFIVSLPPVHPLHVEAIREALDDLVELTSKPPQGAPSFANREPCNVEDLPLRIRVAIDPTWTLLTAEERSAHFTFPRAYVECLEIALRRLTLALNDANVMRLVLNEKAWVTDESDAFAAAAERVARTMLLAASWGSPVEMFLTSPISEGHAGEITWAHLEPFQAVTRAIADFREAVLTRVGQTAETRGTRRPRQRLRVDGQIVMLDGQPVPLGMTRERREEALCYLRHLLEAAGDWRSDSEVDRTERKRPGGLVVSRWDKVRKKLPSCIGVLIETNRRKGSRLKPEAFR